MRRMKKSLALLVAFAMMFSLAIPALAEDITPEQEQTSTYTYSAPTEPMEVDDNIITASAHRAASPILGIMGVNATSGFGMINGSAPTSLAEAQECAAMGIWGSSLNENPDPYYWNYFYNFYAEENGLETSDDALLNGSWSGSPVKADTTLFEEYGNISGSLYTRPDILVGCSSGNGDDVSGYDDQLATIASFYFYNEDGELVIESEYYQDGDENYDPKLVSYQTTTIENMIDSMYALADAITEVEEETGKTTRYGDVQAIAADYESYIYGIIAYVQEELAATGQEQKTFAFVTEVNEDGTFNIGGADYNSATSLGRAYEYCIAAATPLTTKSTTVTLDELLEADVIITLNNQNLTAEAMAEAGVDSYSYDGILITNSPSSLYGITMNSVENAVGYAYVIGSMYCDILDIDPVELCAYFYQHFEHISDLDSLATVVLTNFADTILPEGVSATLSSNYSAASVEAKIIKGMLYYSANETLFDADQFLDSGIDEWTPNYEIGIAAGVSPFTDVNDSSAYYYDAVLWAYSEDITDGMTATTFGPTETLTRAQVVTFLYRAAGSPSVDGIENPFTDVDEDDWYYNAVLWACSEGITNGDGSETIFNPDGSCTRAQVFTFLYRFNDEPEVAADTVNPFTDITEDYYYNAVLWAYSEGITTGTTDTTFGPTVTCERCMIVTILYRALA
ncbi:MAG: S-layer homology domain-containing protein [Oscillospiraceae bacterium]|nr:S-layer homology domain-containing protein [Oscillospiraceae bacterium]